VERIKVRAIAAASCRRKFEPSVSRSQHVLL
jgi:hypothetical protein